MPAQPNFIGGPPFGVERRGTAPLQRSLSEARAWRADTKAALQKGTLRAPTRTSLEEAADDWLCAARAGIARTRSGDPYKPSALRSYEEAVQTKVLPELGHLRLSAVDRVAVKDLVDRLIARGLAPSTVRNSVLPLRAVFAAPSPAPRSSRTRRSTSRSRRYGADASVARPEEARALIAALPAGDESDGPPPFGVFNRANRAAHRLFVGYV